jgi:hypothetical protein
VPNEEHKRPIFSFPLEPARFFVPIQSSPFSPPCAPTPRSPRTAHTGHAPLAPPGTVRRPQQQQAEAHRDGGAHGRRGSGGGAHRGVGVRRGPICPVFGKRDFYDSLLNGLGKDVMFMERQSPGFPSPSAALATGKHCEMGNLFGQELRRC